MQIKLTFKTNENLVLPLGHHSVVQGFIYNILSANPDYSEFLHDMGYGEGKYKFKLFVFSTLRGAHRISGNKIVFKDRIYLEIRSPKDEFCNILLNSLKSDPLPDLYGQKLEFDECAFSSKSIRTESIDINMISPVTLSTTFYECERKKTRFISPFDEDFVPALNLNIKKKYKAAFGNECSSEVMMSPFSNDKEDKYITRFNNIIINAWNGRYHLTGQPDTLSFLYDTGIGSRNSQGFGMFELL